MTRYPALIDGEDGAYGVTFPDLPGVVAMGATIDEALINAEEALRDYALEMQRDGETVAPPSAVELLSAPSGSALVFVPLIQLSGRRIRANFSLDEGVADFIERESRRRRMTKTAFIEWMVRRIAQAGG